MQPEEKYHPQKLTCDFVLPGASNITLNHLDLKSLFLYSITDVQVENDVKVAVHFQYVEPHQPAVNSKNRVIHLAFSAYFFDRKKRKQILFM